jgi:hypothetical protein
MAQNGETPNALTTVPTTATAAEHLDFGIHNESARTNLGINMAFATPHEGVLKNIPSVPA